MLRELRALSLQHQTFHVSYLQHQGRHQGQQQLQLQKQPPQPPPRFRIFKGGGYVAADLEFMLQQSGLAPALQLQHTLAVSMGAPEGMFACEYALQHTDSC
eukprot:1157736-Pelagomonas_calceolata.AAC.4